MWSDALPGLASTVCILAGTHRLHAHAWHNGFPRPPAHLAQTRRAVARLPPLTLFAPEDNQSSAIALEPTLHGVCLLLCALIRGSRWCLGDRFCLFPVIDFMNEMYVDNGSDRCAGATHAQCHIRAGAIQA